MASTPVTSTKILVTQPDGRVVTYDTPYWRREELVLVIDSPVDPPTDQRREILGIHREWWSFQVVRSIS